MAREIPVRIRRLSDEPDGAADLIAPLAVLGILVALIGTTCVPLWTAVAMLADRSPAAVTDAGPTTTPTPATAPATQAAGGPPNAPVLAPVGVLVFLGIAVWGMLGGISTLRRR